MRPALCTVATLVAALSASTARGHEGGQPHPAGAVAPDRLTGMAELGLGWLVLPGAEVCVEPSIAGCSKGDSSLGLEVWQLFRATRSFAAGAGLLLGLTPTTDAPREDPPGVARDHARRYFTFEGTARYYALTLPTVEGWVGLSSGLVVVSDRFESTAGQSDKALVGPRGVTIRTEGYTVGVAVGAAYLFSPSWSLGGALRYGSWFLPEKPTRSPFGDEASLRGQVNLVSFGIDVAYRVPL
ncbi:MAG: hypothetical protein IT375_30290 [Polyangiaceae bacterium]|nr:hypothetical protein [Polyangiaceae bacterium]